MLTLGSINSLLVRFAGSGAGQGREEARGSGVQRRSWQSAPCFRPAMREARKSA